MSKYQPLSAGMPFLGFLLLVAGSLWGQSRELIYDKEAKTAYAAYTADNALHIYLEITDPGQQRKIVQNGLELWVDVKAKKNKKAGIQYPLASSERAFNPPAAGDTGAAGIVRGLQATLRLKKEMTVTGFASPLNGTRSILPDTGLHALLRYRNDTLLYDAQIPLNAFSRPLAPHATISVGIIEKGLLPPGFGEGGMPGDGGGPPGGGDGPPGGGPPGGDNPGGGPPGGGPDEEEMQRAFKDDIIWFQINL
jgi:hypothetical protein